MITTLKVSSILLVLLTLFCHIKAETSLTTESDAEEEEEKIFKVMHENDTFIWSTLSPDNSSSKHMLEDLLDSKGENVWWENDTNFTEYDDLQKKSDASPENSVDRDLLENVNYFLPDQPVMDTSSYTDHKRELPLLESKPVLLSNESTSSLTPELNTSMVKTTCGFGDRKCSILIVESTSIAKRDSFIQPTLITFSTTSFENIPQSSKSGNILLDIPEDISSSVKMLADYVTPMLSESTTIQTSDNLILVEGSEANKDESVIHGQLNKSEKSRQIIKQRDSLSETADEILARTFLKTTEMTPEILVEKESLSSLNTPPFPSTFLTKLLSTTSATFDNSVPIKPVQSSTTDSYFPTKSNTYLLSESLDSRKDMESETSVEHKTLVDIHSPISNTFPSTISWNISKSSVPVDGIKISREEKFLETMPILSPSFIALPTSSEADILIRLKSSISQSPQKSDQLPDSTFISKSSVFIPILKTEVSPAIANTDISTTPIREDRREDAVPPPRLTNPSCSSLPVCVEITLLEITWEQFCNQKHEFQEFLSTSVSHYTRPIHPYHIVLDTEVCTLSSALRAPQSSPDVTVAFYVTNESGEYEERMTEICGVILRKWAPSTFKNSVVEVRLYNSESQSTALPIIPELNSGFVAAVSISAVAGVALCLLCILLVVMKQKLIQGRNSDTTTPTADAYSLDSLSISASFRRRRNRRSARSYLNHAFNDQEIPSHPLNEKSLANCVKSKDLLEEEYKRIPMTMPKLDSIPDGAHVKNRYSNILPKAESRVVLADPSGDPLKCYINANFVKLNNVKNKCMLQGYEGKSAFYIACQAPLPEGIEDFWRMVWEQQSRVIIMLTMFEENGTSRCAVYFPQSTLISQQPFGDFQISLLKKDVYEFYTLSTLRLLDLEKNLFRDIVHLWFTGWPDVGVPKDPSSLVTFVQQCRPFINCNSGPTVIHCSTGTGRTGVFLALDICMREYEESRSVDILQCVSQLRRDRAGAVQNKDQYFLIHEAMLEYISRVANQSQRPSVCS